MKISIEELKLRVGDMCQEIGSALPYEGDQIDGDTWQETADFLRELARHVARGANRIAAYAANAQKRANQE